MTDKNEELYQKLINGVYSYPVTLDLTYYNAHFAAGWKPPERHPPAKRIQTVEDYKQHEKAIYLCASHGRAIFTSMLEEAIRTETAIDDMPWHKIEDWCRQHEIPTYHMMEDHWQCLWQDKRHLIPLANAIGLPKEILDWWKDELGTGGSSTRETL